MQIGDIVVRKSYGKDITFKIIDVKETENGIVYTLKGINLRIIADSPIEDLEQIEDEGNVENEKILNRKVNTCIKNIMIGRMNISKAYRSPKPVNTKDLTFGRPGKILHIDGDAEYLEVCLKVYKQLELDVVGKVIPEKDQPKQILELVKQVKPDIVVITGHDAVTKGTKDFMDINNYRNSRYFIESVNELRNYEPNYDDLVIFAGACQSHYEAILDAGACYTKLRFFIKGREEKSHFFLISSELLLLPMKSNSRVLLSPFQVTFVIITSTIGLISSGSKVSITEHLSSSIPMKDKFNSFSSN